MWGKCAGTRVTVAASIRPAAAAAAELRGYRLGCTIQKKEKKSPESCWCVRTVMKTKEHISSRTPQPFTTAWGARQPWRWAACSPTCFQVQGDPGLVDVRRVALGADPPDRSAVHLFLRGRRHVRPAGAASTGGAAGTARDSAPQRPLVHPPGQTVKVGAWGEGWWGGLLWWWWRVVGGGRERESGGFDEFLLLSFPVQPAAAAQVPTLTPETTVTSATSSKTPAEVW